MTEQTNYVQPVAREGLHQTEFIALVAMLFATIAFSIDSMLPALPSIAAELSPTNPNAAQLVITSFVFGMGIGTFFAGPISDAYGRKAVILGGSALYCLGAIAAWAAPSLELVLAARVLQGLGAAAPRIVSLAMVRDKYSGRAMAQIISFAMIVFMLVPALAPAMGMGIIHLVGWRGLFLAFLLFAVVANLWLGLRQPETLPPERRRPLHFGTLASAFVEVFSHRTVQIATGVMALCFGMLFGTISSIQPIFEQSFDKGDTFPLWFALIALFSALSSFTNASLVMRLGMRLLITTALTAILVLSAVMVGLTFSGLLPHAWYFTAFVIWMVGMFFMMGMVMGNLNALAMEPVGHIAGMAASATGAISTVLGVALAAPLGLAFDGTPLPLLLGILVLAVVGRALMAVMPHRVAT
ncbi:MAG: multidrug MFS transporter [Cereibacter sphaeroides]|uniref:Multidrug MFS transporter n=1 Tax=Cereibacter sphaeroides TaxID=1063 RepID=A0A2W5SCJ0_CERSP|nr:MAG: multidrug MFS transporter [Cereibacter sphaeroides]